MASETRFLKNGYCRFRESCKCNTEEQLIISIFKNDSTSSVITDSEK